MTRLKTGPSRDGMKAAPYRKMGRQPPYMAGRRTMNSLP